MTFHVNSDIHGEQLYQHHKKCSYMHHKKKLFDIPAFFTVYITADPETHMHQNGIWSYKLSLHRKYYSEHHVGNKYNVLNSAMETTFFSALEFLGRLVPGCNILTSYVHSSATKKWCL